MLKTRFSEKKGMLALAGLAAVAAAALAIGVAAAGSPFGSGSSDTPGPHGPITSVDDIDPDECSLVHNIDACERQAIAAAKADLAQRAGVAEDAISVDSVEFVEWPNGCLGIERPDMACILVVTPGYRVVLSDGGRTYEYHTDLTGWALLAE